jgi:hypothetical protein
MPLVNFIAVSCPLVLLSIMPGADTDEVLVAVVKYPNETKSAAEHTIDLCVALSTSHGKGNRCQRCQY